MTRSKNVKHWFDPDKPSGTACGQPYGTGVGSGGTTERAHATCIACLAVPVRVLVADPPWRAKDKLPGPGRGASKHYTDMSLVEIASFPLPKLADDAVLILWRVAWAQEEALQVCRAWGFEAQSELVWVKITKDGKRLRVGMGRYTRLCHETAIIARRIGASPPERKSMAVKSIVYARRGAHSAKPEAAYKAIEKLYAGPYAELFARRARPGWDCYGDALGRPHP